MLQRCARSPGNEAKAILSLLASTGKAVARQLRLCSTSHATQYVTELLPQLLSGDHPKVPFHGCCPLAKIIFNSLVPCNRRFLRNLRLSGFDLLPSGGAQGSGNSLHLLFVAVLGPIHHPSPPAYFLFAFLISRYKSADYIPIAGQVRRNMTRSAPRVLPPRALSPHNLIL
jgi:hypothetical protein